MYLQDNDPYIIVVSQQYLVRFITFCCFVRMLGNIYEVPVQLEIYHRCVLSEYTLCYMCVWFEVHMQMITKEIPLNMMRQPFDTVACCVISLGFGKIMVGKGN